MKHQIHNPQKLTAEQLNLPLNGELRPYRFLDKDEIKDRSKSYEGIEGMIGGGWQKWNMGANEAIIYRTRLTRAELAKLD